MADEAVATVAAVTGASTEIAAQYVQLADGDANQAVQLFFENGGADLAATSSAATNPPPPVPASSSRPAAGSSVDPVPIDDDTISDDNDPEITGYRPTRQADSNVEDDEAMARRIQEEMYGGGGSPTQNIRAPIARTSETLLGPGADAGMGPGIDYDEALQERMRALQNRSRNPPRGIFNQYGTSDIWNNQNDEATPSLSEATGGRSDNSARENMLARLFQPPFQLMYRGSWDDARDEGKENKKWLLVNIQDGSIFDCQALNRDLWKNEGVVETVKAHFVFLQYSKDDPRAEPYLQFYFQNSNIVDMYPHIAIVDPRTGEQIKVWSRKAPPASEFLMQLHEFLDRYSLENHARNPVAKRKSESKPEKTLDQMTEEEQLERALQASMASETSHLQPPATEDPDDLTRSIGDLGAHGKKNTDAMSIYDNGEQATKEEASPFSLIPADRPHSEPAAGPGVTRVQIRHPGGRVVRRFSEDDPVQRIYEYLKAEPLEGKQGVEFELISMGKNLLESRTETINAAGLKNGTVMVEFVEY